MMIIELGKQRTSNDLEKFLQVSMNVVGRSAFRQKKNRGNNIPFLTKTTKQTPLEEKSRKKKNIKGKKIQKKNRK